MNIIEISLNLEKINKEITTFNFKKTIYGILHVSESGTVTVMFDGGYKFGEFH